MNRKTLSKVIILLLLVFSFHCGKQSSQSDSLIVGVSGDTDSLNPLFSVSRLGKEISQMLFLNLLEEQPDFSEFKPELADSWETLNNGEIVRFHLNTRALWTDGVPVTANDVEFTFGLQTNEKIGWSGASVKDRISKVVAVDDSTVEFHISEPYLDQLMDINDGVILPKHQLEGLSVEELKDFSFSKMIVGSGPYKIKSYVSNQYIEFINNPDCFRIQPKIKHIVFKIIPDQNQMFTQLQTGEIQVLDGLTPQNAAGIKDKKLNINVQSFPYVQYVEIAWNLNNPLFDSKEIRTALTQAIDRDALVNHLLIGYGSKANSPIHPMLWAYKQDLPELAFDPQAAKNILKANGWIDSDGDGVISKNGKPFEFKLVTNIGSQVREDAIIMVQEMLGKVGIKVVPQKLEWSVYVEKLLGKQYDAVLLGMMSPTKVDVYPAWHSSMAGPDGFNFSCYQNSTVDKLIENARNLKDRKDALPLWYEFQEIIVSDQPASFLWIPDRIVALDPSIKGFKFSPVSTFFNISEWYFD